MRKKALDPYVRAVLATIRRRALLSATDTVLAAVSAGPDSTALVAALAALRDRGELGAVAALHVDHGLRPGGGEDAACASAACARLGVPFESVRVRVARGNVQAEARRARYAALRDAAARVQASRIATGHTRTDQAETVLLRLLRGAGARGLGAIPPRRGPFVRPLIDRPARGGDRFSVAARPRMARRSVERDPALRAEPAAAVGLASPARARARARAVPRAGGRPRPGGRARARAPRALARSRGDRGAARGPRGRAGRGPAPRGPAAVAGGRRRRGAARGEARRGGPRARAARSPRESGPVRRARGALPVRNARHRRLAALRARAGRRRGPRARGLRRAGPRRRRGSRPATPARCPGPSRSGRVARATASGPREAAGRRS